LSVATLNQENLSDIKMMRDTRQRQRPSWINGERLGKLFQTAGGNYTMKHSKAQAYIRQLCCLGLGKEVLIPELLRAIHTVVPSESNVFTGVNGNMVPTYVIPEHVLPEVHLSDSARSLLFLATHGAFPVGSGPFQPGGRDAASVAANLRKSQRNFPKPGRTPAVVLPH